MILVYLDHTANIIVNIYIFDLCLKVIKFIILNVHETFA